MTTSRAEVALVTGGIGSLGRLLSAQLAARGMHVLALDSRVDANSPVEHSGAIEEVYGDVLDADSLDVLIRERGVDVVVHLAAIIGGCVTDPARAVRVNVEGTVNILDAAHGNKCRRVVYLTSRAALGTIVGVHGPPDYVPIDESYPRRPVTLYGATKLAAESVCQAYRRTRGLDVIGLRLPAVYGPDRLVRHGGFALISDMIEHAATDRAFEIQSGGEQVDDVLFGDDAARALALAVTSPRQDLNYVYHISSGAMTRPIDYMKELQRRFPSWQCSAAAVSAVGSDGYPSYCRFDDSAAREDLGYRPKYDVSSGIEAYLDLLSVRERM